jgi:hypothetical protein
MHIYQPIYLTTHTYRVQVFPQRVGMQVRGTTAISWFKNGTVSLSKKSHSFSDDLLHIGVSSLWVILIKCAYQYQTRY